MVKTRYLEQYITSDLKEKMAFVGGPRQVGKTTLARHIGETEYKQPFYLNWDNREDRKIILDQKFDASSDILIFDEIHKYKQWKNYLKGEYDKYKDKFNILVTGSARLDLYKKGGDSLMGRYHHFRLHPFSLAESLEIQPQIKEPFLKLNFLDERSEARQTFLDLFHYGGFPEPFLKKDEITLRRFHNERIDRLIKEDIRDIEILRDLSALQTLVEILPAKVGSLLSLNSLREDLEVAHKTISLWMNVLERFYYHFRIYPYAATAIKSLRKEPKMYLWDWSEAPDGAARFENIIASHLLKTAHFLEDTAGFKVELNFLRDVYGKEMDFLVSVQKKPWFAVETKLTSKELSQNLIYFKEKLKIPFVFQVVKEQNVDFLKNGIRIISADKFLSGLV